MPLVIHKSKKSECNYIPNKPWSSAAAAKGIINQSQGLVLITYREPAQVGFLLAGQDLQGSGFANTIGADQPQDFTRSGCWQSEGKAHELMTACLKQESTDTEWI